MINKDWRRRFKVLSERLETSLTPSLECEFALQKFKDVDAPVKESKVQLESRSYREQAPEVDVNAAMTKAVDKALDLGIMADILLNKSK
jgi:hypothetical protein